MIPCYLGLGSNLDNPIQQIQTALKALAALPNTQFKKASPIYQSLPAETPRPQPIYHNAVVLIETYLSPEALLTQCHNIEYNQKRVRVKRFDARTIDIDILLYGTNTINTKTLTIPHPRLQDRDFVLRPLLDLWPEASLPDGTSLMLSLKTLKSYYIPI